MVITEVLLYFSLHSNSLVNHDKYNQARLLRGGGIEKDFSVPSSKSLKTSSNVSKTEYHLLIYYTAKCSLQSFHCVRSFIEGFITRGGPETELNYRFIQIARKQYLIRLSQNLPQSMLVISWPVCPVVCRDVSIVH